MPGAVSWSRITVAETGFIATRRGGDGGRRDRFLGSFETFVGEQPRPIS